MTSFLTLAPESVALENIRRVREAPAVGGEPLAHGHTFPEVIDSTNRKGLSSCEQYWWYSCVESIQPGAESVHLHAGAAFARGLEVFRTEFFLGGKTREAAVDAARIAMLVEWGDFVPMFTWDLGHSPKTLDALFDALDYYLATWPPETDPVQPIIQDGRIGVEFSFAVPIPDCYHPLTGQPLLYAGRFDMLGSYDGVLYVVDEKTTSRLGPTWADQWTMRSQFTGYCWAAQQYGFPVGGAIVRGISFLKGGFGSAEAITMREQWKIDRWLRTLQSNVDRMIAIWRTGAPVPNLDESCNAYGGCPYKVLCDSPDPAPWKADFVKRTWNPLARV